jgi:hypothetical protein
LPQPPAPVDYLIGAKRLQHWAQTVGAVITLQEALGLLILGDVQTRFSRHQKLSRWAGFGFGHDHPVARARQFFGRHQPRRPGPDN